MPKIGLWAQAISPYDNRILDFCMPADPLRSVVVSTQEEFLLHRVMFLVLGMVLMAVAHTLSKSVVFYYGGAMTIGVFLVILIILFQSPVVMFIKLHTVRGQGRVRKIVLDMAVWKGLILLRHIL